MPPTSTAATVRSSPRVKCFSTSFCIAVLISIPGGSKNWIRITSGSFGLTPTWNPALCASDFTRCRATAAGLTRRSATWTPVDEMPEIIARLIILHAGAPADVGGRVDDRAHDPAALADRDARREHRVGADVRATRDPAVVAQVRGPLDRVEVVEVHPVPQPDVAADPDPVYLEPHALVERVEIRLPVLVEIPDVLPVTVEDMAVDRATHLEQQREQLLRKVVRPVLRDVLQHLGLEHVDAGVYRVGEDLAPGRLLEESLDASVLVGDDDAELQRVLDRLEPDRHRGALLAVRLDEAVQIDVAEGVTRDDEERVVEPSGCALDGARGAERRLLHRIADVDAERLAGAEVAPDRL